jgi:hypothetical protein
MSSSRGPVPSVLFTVITEDLRTGSVTKAQLVAGTRNAIQRGVTNRVFDEIPHLVDEMTLASLGRDYIQIVQDARFSGEDNLVLNIAAKKQMEDWVKKLIKQGMAELFDEKGNIKPSLVELFGWGDLCEQIDKNKLICAYVGAVTAQVQVDHQGYIVADLSGGNGRVSNYISVHYSQWVDELMPATSSIHYGKVATVAGAGILFGLVGVVATVGLFAATTNAAPVNNSLGYNSPKP